MGRILGIAALAFAGACAYPATRMVPVYDYGSRTEGDRLVGAGL